jgi:hypothetical protein
MGLLRCPAVIVNLDTLEQDVTGRGAQLFPFLVTQETLEQNATCRT